MEVVKALVGEGNGWMGAGVQVGGNRMNVLFCVFIMQSEGSV